MDEYWVNFFPYWRCQKCGRRYHALENYCFFCKEKSKRPTLPPRHQYREVEWLPSGKASYYENDINIRCWE